MAIYLAGIPVFTIMVLGRWLSDAFLHYIHKQVKELSREISNKVIMNENFFTIPSSSNDDQKTLSRPSNYDSRFIIGTCFKETIRPLVSAFQ
jgi:hypothetical protein